MTNEGDEGADEAAAPGNRLSPLPEGWDGVERRVSTEPSALDLLRSDPHDFAGLYIRHRSSFGLHARRYLKDQRDIDEVVQEAFLRLFLALPELETELQALAYCRRTITNLCIDRYRADQRRPRLVELESVPVDDLPESELEDPVVRAEDAAVIRMALSLLSPLHQSALVKREIEEKTLPEIARELDLPEEKVKHLLFRARRALRRILIGTQVNPGVSDEQASTASLLLRRASEGGGRAGVLLLVLTAAVVTGPNLHAIPLVGRDLPDLPSLTELTKPGRVPPATVPAPAPTFTPHDVVRRSGRPSSARPPSWTAGVVVPPPAPAGPPSAGTGPVQERPAQPAPAQSGGPAPVQSGGPAPAESGRPAPAESGGPAPVHGAGPSAPRRAPTPTPPADPSPTPSPSASPGPVILPAHVDEEPVPSAEPSSGPSPELSPDPAPGADAPTPEPTPGP